MGLFDFFKKKAETKPLVQQPPQYWEESSYMQAVPSSDEYILDEGMLDRIGGIEGLTVKSFEMPAEKYEGNLVLDHEGEEYKVSFFWSQYELPQLYQHPNQFFAEDEINALKSVKKALTFYMKFGKDPQKSYHLQLKLAVAMLPDLMGLVDESAEKLLCPRWVKMAASSYVLPAYDCLYSVQAINEDKGEVWLHTHGLARCGITELEILNSDTENYNNHYYVISTYAGRLLDKSVAPDEEALIGRFSNGDAVAVKGLVWTEALAKYPRIAFGGAKDRQDSHNGLTSVIFICEDNGLLSPVDEYNDLLNDNPLFFISTEETARMSMLARERFEYMKGAARQGLGTVLIKVALPTEHGDTPEHIWFELKELTENGFRAVLKQEPYDVPTMHEGDEGEYTIDDVTDWMLLSEKLGRITPETAYLIQ